MQNAKNERLTIRMSEEERERLEMKAQSLGLTTSELLRFKIFEEETQELPKLQTRILLAVHYTLQKMAAKQLTEKEIEKIKHEANAEMEKLGVAKGGK